MKLPKDFMPKKDLKKTTKGFLEEYNPPRKIESPDKIKSLMDAIKYLADSTIPAYGYDDKKRIKQITDSWYRHINIRKVMIFLQSYAYRALMP